MASKNQWQDTQKQWKAFPLDWELYTDYNNADDEIKRLTPFQIGILLAAVYPYRWDTRWLNLGISRDELDKQISEIEDRLMQTEDTGMATKDDIRDGMYEAMNRLAAQIVSGRFTDIAVSEDGTVSQPSAGGAEDIELPEDDPATPLVNEEFAAKAGGVINVRLTIQRIFNDLAAWHFGAITAAVAESRLILLYGLEAGANLTAFVNYYWTVDPTPDTVILLLEVLDSMFFCRGLNSQTYASYCLNAHVLTAERETLLKLTPLLTPELLSAWYETGIDAPSTDYFNYSCVRADDETIVIATINPNYTTLTQWKINHRLRITATGAFVDPTGIIRDLWYYKPVGGAVQNAIASTNVTVGAGVPKPTTTENPYNVAHKYTWTTETLFTSAMVLQVLPHGVINAPLTGTISVLIEDLGEIGY